MKCRIEVDVHKRSDLLEALALIQKQIREGFVEGHDRRDGLRFTYSTDGPFVSHYRRRNKGDKTFSGEMVFSTLEDAKFGQPANQEIVGIGEASEIIDKLQPRP